MIKEIIYNKLTLTKILNEIVFENNKLIKKEMNGVINDEIQNKIKKFITKKYNDIMANLTFINLTILTIDGYVMDTYLLARLFKKSMWNNPKTAVIFTGYFHSNNYTEFLLDVMDFKIVAEARPINRRCLNIEGFKQPLFRKDINYMNKANCRRTHDIKIKRNNGRR